MKLKEIELVNTSKIEVEIYNELKQTKNILQLNKKQIMKQSENEQLKLQKIFKIKVKIVVKIIIAENIFDVLTNKEDNESREIYFT